MSAIPDPRLSPRPAEELPRRQRRKLEVRNRILEAATVLFDESGFNATSVARICERADIAHKTFFNHFPAKQDLIREVAHLAMGEFLDDVDLARQENSNTRDRILQVFRQVAENALSMGPMHRELLSEIIYAIHGSGEDAEQAGRLHEAFSAIVRDGIAAGEITERYDERTLTEMIMGAFYVLMFQWVCVDEYPLREQALRSAQFLADSMLAAPARPSGEEVADGSS